MDISDVSMADGAKNIQWPNSGGSTADGAQNIQWTSNGGTNQQWTIN